ncbi:glycosyltransferase family 2 protein [Bordetella sp. H567]|uniref:glycosyltransferase family 2 protein n=1 Tax=Bordetella sp. H567 TaxID=1697043 RepID=UPI0008326E67|nr:glycosyltransferase [Bordetella sp. H567]
MTGRQPAGTNGQPPHTDGRGSRMDGPPARGEDEPRPADRDAPRVSVVVLTHERRDELLSNLGRLRERHPGVPVIVVDNGSRDGTAQAVAAAFPEVTLVRASGNLGAAGRNLGVSAARTPYIAFCDDDTCWESGALEAAQQLLDAAPRAGVISACVLVGPHGSVDPTCDIMARSPLGPGPAGTMRLMGFMAGACIVRREAYLQAGGYEPRFFIGGEEELLTLDMARLGWEMLYAGHIRTWHHPSPRRDRPRRVHLLSRNALWTAWLRLPLRAAWEETRSVLHQCARPGQAARVLLAALAGVPWILRYRACIPPEVERQRRLVVGPRASATPGTLARTGRQALPALPHEAENWRAKRSGR